VRLLSRPRGRSGAPGPRLACLGPRLAGLAILAVLVGGCVPITAVASGAPPPVSLAPVPGVVSQTASALEAAYRQADLGFIRAQQAYRPSEPLPLQSATQTVYQVMLPRDPEAGYVVIFAAADAGGARVMASELQQYLQSGFGQTNFPTDAQFAISIYGPTVTFGWYSPGASVDPATAKKALDVLLAFGQPVPVVR
jgi:hypothetical protein